MICIIQVKDFSTVTDACFTQFRLILGDFNFPAIEDANPFFGPMYFVLYIFFVFFILMGRIYQPNVDHCKDLICREYFLHMGLDIS